MSNTKLLRVGEDYNGNFFDGMIDDVRVFWKRSFHNWKPQVSRYPYVLTQEQIQKVMNQGAMRVGG